MYPNLCGYILVKGSPSCGHDRVKRFNKMGKLVAYDQQGAFSAALSKAAPLLPLEDDARLNDTALRESFIARAYAYHDWQMLKMSGLNKTELLNYYSRYKHLVMAHHVPTYNQWGHMLANLGRQDVEPIAEDFITMLMEALK